MALKNDKLVPLSRTIRALFEDDEDALVIYDIDFGGTFLADWITLESQVDVLIDPDTIDGNMEGATKDRNTFMGNCNAFVIDADYKTQKGIINLTITDSLDSFGYGRLLDSISQDNIGTFRTNSNATRDKITSNSSALHDLGITALKITEFEGNCDNAWAKNNLHISLKNSKSNLVVINAATRKSLMDTLSTVINGGHAWAKSIGNLVRAEKYVMAAALRATRPTPVRVPRIRHFTALQSIIFQRNIPGNHVMQFELLTDEYVTIGRSETIDGVPIATMTLKLDTVFSLKLKEIPGKGNFVKIINNGFKRVQVRVFVVIP